MRWWSASAARLTCGEGFGFQATKLYCFVHKVPVCGECICFPEHQICVARTYSDWVIDGDYEWPPSCCLCQAVLKEGTDSQTTRLGCLHVVHTNCLVSHIKSFPLHTAPAGYVCPACSTSIWPPKSIKDSGSRLHSKLKEAIMQMNGRDGEGLRCSVMSNTELLIQKYLHGLRPELHYDFAPMTLLLMWLIAQRERSQENRKPADQEAKHWDRKDITCYTCSVQGHFSTAFPRKTMAIMEDIPNEQDELGQELSLPQKAKRQL
ncbi:hypothetical protein HHK36_002731 [Tetracentron sinense]|uniref:RING-type domain-containing protein n=1 Tax=Tetracentron sinense TaxID=13715 RepID=A0A835DRE3_TETSI|nr:hypothetical protein HHK36_002731 [Tetracentron sinense]